MAFPRPGRLADPQTLPKPSPNPCVLGVGALRYAVLLHREREKVGWGVERLGFMYGFGIEAFADGNCGPKGAARLRGRV